METFQCPLRQRIPAQCKTKQNKELFFCSLKYQGPSVTVNTFFHFASCVTHQGRTWLRAEGLRQDQEKGDHTSQFTPSVSAGNWRNVRKDRSVIKKRERREIQGGGVQGGSITLMGPGAMVKLRHMTFHFLNDFTASMTLSGVTFVWEKACDSCPAALMKRPSSSFAEQNLSIK